MSQRRALILALSLLGLTPAVPGFSQPSRCADCHYATPAAPGRRHLQNWDASPHGRQGVGCERCHRGNATVFEPMLAHRGIVPSVDAKSSTHRRNLPATCGGCHAGPLAAFRASKHADLLQSGDNDGPTCSTCHGSVEGWLLSPKALASECNACHGPGEAAPRLERARLVREQYESLRVVREQMNLAESLIARVEDKQRRTELVRAYNEARVPLTRAVDAGHRFVYDELREHLVHAQAQAEALLQRLANR